MNDELAANGVFPRITLLTAIFNGERFFKESVASIRAMRYLPH